MSHLNIKILFLFGLASFASMGTFPYAYRFACQESVPYFLQNFLGILFGCSATFANIILGFNALLQCTIKRWNIRSLLMTLLSFFGSIPLGFICFFGFHSILNNNMNILMSLVVIIVNAAIGYYALVELLKKVSNLKSDASPPKPFHVLDNFFKKRNPKNIFVFLWIFIGFVVSLVGYLSANLGLKNLFAVYQFHFLAQYQMSYIFSLFTWIPFAALYINANHFIALELYKMFTQLKSASVTFAGLIFFLLFLSSGTAFAEMIKEFFARGRMICDLLSLSSIQHLVHFLLMPLALVSSAAVNYFSMHKLFTKLLHFRKLQGVNFFDIRRSPAWPDAKNKNYTPASYLEKE